MSDPSSHPHRGAEPRAERLRPWLSALLSALLHVLLLLILLYAATPVVTPPQGAASGGRVKVDFVGEPAPATEPEPSPPSPDVKQARKPVPDPKPRDRQDLGKPVLEAKYILPEPEPEPAQSSAASSPPSAAQRRPQQWTGRPPGLIEEDIAEDDGRSHGPANRQGHQDDMEAGEPSMEVGGYQIVYDLLGEERLRGWIEQGMKEVSIPLPGTRQRMVCPADVALKRGSSKCRLLDPGDPEMQAIGDARQVITVMYVYRRGELVWRGPGAYR